jgi:hypothetical protein
VIEDTFARAAQAGEFYELTCQQCRHRTHMTAKEVCLRGKAHFIVAGSQRRFKCTKCGTRGKLTMTRHGHWTGPDWGRPDDWADTVEQRITGGSDPPPQLETGALYDRRCAIPRRGSVLG